jgi:hypothetical protein
VKFWFIALLVAPALAWSQTEAGDPKGDTLCGWEAAAPEECRAEREALEELEEEDDINWVDDSHAYVTDQAQALTEWMDNFFGDPDYELDQAESRLRLELISDWDQDDGNEQKLRLRGKLQVPRISRRLNLVFSGQDGDTPIDADRDERALEDVVGLQYEVRTSHRSRLDATLGFASGKFRPGVRFRLEDGLGENSNYRFTQRVQYEDGEQFFATTLLDLNRALGENRLLRWSNRGLWGEKSEGVEWRTKLGLRERRYADSRHPLAVNYFGAVSGETRPAAYVKNYRLGVLLRRQVYRDYLFMELEPAYNYRKQDADDDRDWAWSLVFRLEVALQRDLRRLRQEVARADDAAGGRDQSPLPQQEPLPPESDAAGAYAGAGVDSGSAAEPL